MDNANRVSPFITSCPFWQIFDRETYAMLVLRNLLRLMSTFISIKDVVKYDMKKTLTFLFMICNVFSLWKEGSVRGIMGSIGLAVIQNTGRLQVLLYRQSKQIMFVSLA